MGREGQGALSIHPGPSGPARLCPHLLVLQILPAFRETCHLLEFVLVSLDFYPYIHSSEQPVACAACSLSLVVM